MAENTKISWATHTFNGWMGCTKVSPACKNCYAERDMDHRYGKVQWGPNGTRVMTSDENWKKPIKWNKEAHAKGIRYRVFCSSLADVFEDWKGPIVVADGRRVAMKGDQFQTPGVTRLTRSVGDRWATMDDLRDRLFRVIDATPNLDWLLLTKRPENIRKMWLYRDVPFRGNAWLGTSVENQDYANERLADIMKCRDLSPVIWLSCEPLLSDLDLRPALWLEDQYFKLRKNPGGNERGIDWVIAGGESGPDARPSHPDWFRSLRDQCGAANVPFHFKQWGEWKSISEMPQSEYGKLYKPNRIAKPHQNQDALNEIYGHSCTVENYMLQFDGAEGAYAIDKHPGFLMFKVGVAKAGRKLDGVEHDAFPIAQVQA